MFFQFSLSTTLFLLIGFYLITFAVTLLIGRKKENVDAYMVSTQRVGFGLSAAGVAATWIWAASFYAAATSGYQYGISGPIHYGLWGALMIFFIYPFGQRFRALAPNAHTLGEVIYARHGSSSQLILALSNVLGSTVSLMANFTAAGALVQILTPLSFVHGVLFAALGTLSYALWSGIRASILTDFVQVSAMILIAVIIIPTVLFSMGGPAELAGALGNLTAEQANPFSSVAILEQGAPFFVAVLSYAIGNQTISQRLFAVRQDRIKPTFLTATVAYGSVVIGLGMLGMMALITGVRPAGDDPNNLIPQVASEYLPPVLIGMLFILVIASLSSTADSDLAALSAIMMADVYGRNIARGKPKLSRMLMIGRVTMITATAIGLIFASMNLDILVLLVFVGALWGAIVFPTIVSCFWNRVTNRAFTSAVISALVVFTLVRFEFVPLVGVLGLLGELIAAIGGGVVIGLMAFAFTSHRVAIVLGALTAMGLTVLFVGFLREYTVLTSSLIAYGVSAIVCVAVTLSSRDEFDFDLIQQRVGSFQQEREAMSKTATASATDAGELRGE